MHQFPLKYCYIQIVIILLLLGYSFSSRAQENQINFKRYTINEGLSQNSVYCLLQDREGLIWIGTEDGLNTFDGYEFTYYKHEYRNPNSVSHNQINALFEGRDGRIWVGTSNGLNVFDKRTKSFTHLVTTNQNQANSSEYITSIFEDKRKNIWVTSLEGLKLYDPAKNTFHLFNYKESRADKIMEDSQGIFWVSVARDLRRFDPNKQKFLPLPPLLENNDLLRNSFIRAIERDSSNKIWIGTEMSGLFVYDEGANTLENYRSEKSNKNSLPIDIIRDIYFHNKDEVWVGTRDGLSIYNRSTKQFTNYKSDRYNPTSLSQNSIRTILQDRSGNVWLGTFAGGVNLITFGHSVFNYIGAETLNKPGLTYHIVSAIAGAKDGGLWIGTEGGGLNYTNKDRSYFKSYSLPKVSSNLTVNTIKSILPDGGNLWVGTYKGLSYFDSSIGSLKDVPIPLGNRDVTTVVKTGDDLWIGTNGAGLILRDKNGNTSTYTHNPANVNSISRNNVITIVKDKHNSLWIGTSRGLNYFNRKKFKQFHHDINNPFSLSNNSISSLFIDSKERVWVGTKGGGLNLYDKSSGRFYVIDKDLGLANDVIQSIEEDNTGRLWVSTNKGLSKIVIKSKPPFTNKTVEVSNYFVEDGLQSNQFLLNSSYKNETGELFFGGINGLTHFHPDNIVVNQYKPPVILTEFAIRNRPVVQYGEGSPLRQSINETEEITLKYDQAFISFKFAALNYVNPIKNQYAYKLQGFQNDDDWHFVGDQRYATYTNLDAGTYVFRVKASNNDGVWNEEAKSIRIVVLPPWWKTWWAYSLYVLIIASLLYLYYSYSLKTAKLKNQLAFEHLIHEKDHELYQRKLNFFTNISHEIKTPLTLILAPLDKLIDLNVANNRVQHQLMLMKRNGDRLMRLIGQLLDFRKFESGNMQLQASEGDIAHFVKEVVYAFGMYAKHLNVELLVETDKKDIKLWFDPDKVEKILYNLLSNALKFTRAEGVIKIRVREIESEPNENGFVLIEVEDTGIGISEDKLSKLFQQFKHFDEEGLNLHGSGIGLAFTKGLVEMHGGEIFVESTPESAEKSGKTCFTIKFLKGRAHLKDEEIVVGVEAREYIERYADEEPRKKPSEILEMRKAKVLSKMDESPILLIVEDNKEVMSFLREHFEDKFQIHTAFDGREGVEKAINIVPDIVISDVMMPLMSGIELCSTLKTDSRTSHIPIILLTARAPVVYKIEGLETGADDYITKPFNINIVEARVWNLLEQRQQLRERYRKEITLQPHNLAITSPDEVFLEKVLAYIEAHIADSDLSVEDLAQDVFMSRTTLYRKIKALTNQTTVELIRSVRLKRAAQLLEKNTYSISEVAYMTGFTEINYFRKCFKEQFKQTPTDYQNNKMLVQK